MTRVPRLPRLVHLFPGKKRLTREGLPRVAQEPAERSLVMDTEENLPRLRTSIKLKAFGIILLTEILLDGADAPRPPSAMHRTRSPLTLGWEAARANALPALIIQALMLMLLVSFYTSHAASTLLSQFAELKRTHDILFVVVQWRRGHLFRSCS